MSAQQSRPDPIRDFLVRRWGEGRVRAIERWFEKVLRWTEVAYLIVLALSLLVGIVYLSYQVISHDEAIQTAERVKRRSDIINATMVIVGVLTSMSFSYVRALEAVEKDPDLTEQAHAAGENLLFGLAGLIICALLNFAAHDAALGAALGMSGASDSVRVVVAVVFAASILVSSIGLIVICYTAFRRQYKQVEKIFGRSDPSTDARGSGDPTPASDRPEAEPDRPLPGDREPGSGA